MIRTQQQLMRISAHGAAVMRIGKSGAHSNRPCHTARVWREEVQKHQASKYLQRESLLGTGGHA